MLKKEFSEIMPERKKDSHKGDYGHVLVLAGSKGLTGAAALCSLGALRSGCGLVTLGIPKSLNAIMETKLTEVMTRPLPETKNISLSLEALPKIKKMLKGVNAVALGPGLSTDKGTKRLVNKLVKLIDKPLVIDADGLNCICSNIKALKSIKSPIIITPHPGEMSRLSGLEINTIQRNRQRVAKDLARQYNLIVVLKGNNTVVSDGKANNFVNKSGNPGMATGGTGDILTGMIASFLAQGVPAFNAAKLAVYIHGKAGDLAAREKGEIGLIAGDILEKVPEAFK